MTVSTSTYSTSDQKAGTKIAIVISGKSATGMPGGLGAYAHNLCRIFHELGYVVYLLGYDTRTDLRKLAYATQITIRNPFARLSSLSAALTNRLLGNEIIRIQAAASPDKLIIIGAGIWSAAGLVARNRTRLPNCTVMGAYFTTYLHEYAGQVRGCPTSDYGWLSWLSVKAAHLGARLLANYEHRTLRSLDTIVTHYESSEQILRDEVTELDADNFYRTAYYVELFERGTCFNRPPARLEDQVTGLDRQNPISIGVLCRQDPRKGINIFLHATKLLQQVTEQPFTCAIAGNGVFLDKNRALAEKLSLSNLVNFRGFIPSSEEFINQTDIIVLPSFEEGAGAISILEAMKLGKPIVSSNCDGIPEDLTHEINSLMFTPGNPLELSEQLKRLLEDTELRVTLGSNAQKSYEEKFSFNSMKLGFSELLATLPS